MRKIKYPRIDSIPPELCTAEEAAQILGLKSRWSLNLSIPRYKSLKYALVTFNGKQISLFNRKDIEALRHRPAPEGYITTREAGNILGYTPDTLLPTIYACLKKHEVPRLRMKAAHAFMVWLEKDVREVAKKKEEEKKCQTA